jgi:hypothetical protein
MTDMNKAVELFDHNPSCFDIVGVHVRVVEKKWWKPNFRSHGDGANALAFRTLISTIGENFKPEHRARGLIFEAEFNSQPGKQSLSLLASLSWQLHALLQPKDLQTGQPCHRPVLFIAKDTASLAAIQFTLLHNVTGLHPLFHRTIGLVAFPDSTRGLWADIDIAFGHQFPNLPSVLAPAHTPRVRRRLGSEKAIIDLEEDVRLFRFRTFDSRVHITL